MKKEKEKNITTDLQISDITDLQTNYKEMADEHLAIRFANNPEFKSKFIKTFSDLVFSQNEDILELLPKMKKNSLLNSVFKATEAGASFGKGEVHLLPFKIFKKTKEGNVEKKVDTGEYTAVLVLDVNFQKQQILKLQNCKRFFTAEVHEGVKVIENLVTGNYEFIGENDVTKPTIGYYAVFVTTEGEIYDEFMTNAEIVDRAKSSPQFDANKYKQTNNNVHYEKVVIRNLIKDIPKISDELKSIMAVDDIQYSEYVEVHDTIEAPKKKNVLEEAKKEIADLPADFVKAKGNKKKENVDESTGEVTEDEFF